MQQSNIGRSAYGAAVMKALESFLPTGQRLFDDAVVLEFLPGLLRFGLRSAWVRRQFAAMMDRGAPGIRGAILCRTRYIDDVVRDAVGKGTTRVVLLGAGLDTRPYRLSELSTVKVIEIDLPAVQAFKRAQVVRRFGSIPRHLQFVSTDFETEPLDATLRRSGLAIGEACLFVWEGVTQYLKAAAVDAVFHAIAVRPPPTELVFTYVLDEVVTGRFRADRNAAFRKSAGRRPEPWHFGIEPSRLGSWLSARGLTLLDDVGTAEYRARYLKPRERDLDVAEIERVARAVVGVH